MRPARGASALAACLAATTLVACSGDEPAERAAPHEPRSAREVAEDDPLAAPAADDLADAESETRRDSHYPDVGDPLVDALHYGLDLRWDREARELGGTAAVTFRATEDAEQVRLDLAPSMRVSAAVVDGEEVDVEHTGRDLLLAAPVEAEETYLAEITYTGTPRPVRAPSTRTDVSESGMRVTADGWLWTLQSPYGAFTWYPVNDQPADKARYDVRIDVPAPWRGIAGGLLVSEETDDGRRVSHWELDEPAAAYLTTLAVGDYVATREETASGVPVTTWTPRGDEVAAAALAYSAEAIDWSEQRLGPYPFDVAGGVLVEAQSAMETQTLPTYGDTDYTRSRAVVVHELVHQWYGDRVTPTDWRDLWMSEGMTTYLQMVWQVEEDGQSWRSVLDLADDVATASRASAGPPGDPDPQQYADSTVYYGPALMWHTLRAEVGEEPFWSMVRDWPAEAPPSPTREEYLDWLVDDLEGASDLDLEAFLTSWLDDRRQPPFDPVPLPAG